MRLLNKFSGAVMLALLAGCSANHHSIYRHAQLTTQPTVTLVDAKQRAILSAAPASGASVNTPRFCAEPSPDVFAVIAQSLSGGASFGQGSDPKAVQAALNAAFSTSEQGSTIPRTQTTNTLRELMYRTCERYLSGGISDVELSIQAVRDQRLIVSILAIESLTGAVATKPTVIGVSSNASSGANQTEAVVRLDDQKKVVEAKSVALKKKTTEFNDLNGTAKDCEVIAKAVTDKKEDSLSDGLKAKRTKCETAAADLAVAKQEKADADAHYGKLAGVAVSAGIPVSVGNTTMIPVAAGGLDHVQQTEMGQVAVAIKEIVAGTFDQDEYLFLCLKVLQDATGKLDAAKVSCMSYINSRVEVERVRNEDKIAAAAVRIEAVSASLFDQFWSQVSTADKPDAAKLGAVQKKFSQQSWPACFASATSKDLMRICFNSLTSPKQRALAKGGSNA